MNSPDDPHCPHSLSLSHEELASLNWLLGVVDKISKNPKSCNRQKAALSAITLEKMRDALLDMHASLHFLEEKIAEQAQELAYNNLIVAMSKKSSQEGLN